MAFCKPSPGLQTTRCGVAVRKYVLNHDESDVVADTNTPNMPQLDTSDVELAPRVRHPSRICARTNYEFAI